MAISNKTSDMLNIRIEHDPEGTPVIEMDFTFVRYRLVIDNKERAEQFAAALLEASADRAPTATPVKPLPKFYKR
jgi:hypothetical protein